MNDKTQPDNQGAARAAPDPVRYCGDCRYNEDGYSIDASGDVYHWRCKKYKKKIKHHPYADHSDLSQKLPECIAKYGYEPPEEKHRRSEAQPTKDPEKPKPENALCYHPLKCRFCKREMTPEGCPLARYWCEKYKKKLGNNSDGYLVYPSRLSECVKEGGYEPPEEKHRGTETAPTKPDDGDDDLFEGPMYEPEKHRGTETAPTEPEPQKPDDAVVLQRAANGSIATGLAIIKLVQRHNIYRRKCIKLLHENNDLLNKVRELQLNVDVRDDRMTALEQEINNLRLRRNSLEHDNKELQQQNSSLYEDLANYRDD